MAALQEEKAFLTNLSESSKLTARREAACNTDVGATLFRTKEPKEQQTGIMEMCITGYGIPLSISMFFKSLFDKMQEICYTRIC